MSFYAIRIQFYTEWSALYDDGTDDQKIKDDDVFDADTTMASCFKGDTTQQALVNREFLKLRVLNGSERAEKVLWEMIVHMADQCPWAATMENACVIKSTTTKFKKLKASVFTDFSSKIRLAKIGKDQTVSRQLVNDLIRVLKTFQAHLVAGVCSPREVASDKEERHHAKMMKDVRECIVEMRQCWMFAYYCENTSTSAHSLYMGKYKLPKNYGLPAPSSPTSSYEEDFSLEVDAYTPRRKVDPVVRATQKQRRSGSATLSVVKPLLQAARPRLPSSSEEDDLPAPALKKQKQC